MRVGDGELRVYDPRRVAGRRPGWDLIPRTHGFLRRWRTCKKRKGKGGAYTRHDSARVSAARPVRASTSRALLLWLWYTW